MITTIPFSGFYDSFHSDELDRELEQMVSDSSGCNPISKRLANEVWDCVDMRDAQEAYAKEYAEYFAHWFECEFKVSLTFESMSSPREYNFATDRIFCNISTEDVQKLFATVKPEILAKLAKDKFTSRSGFISFYPSDVSEWGNLETWDHNKIGTLIESAVIQSEESDLEMDIVEKMCGNGAASNAIYSALNDKGKRISKIAHYLRERSERKYA